MGTAGNIRCSPDGSSRSSNYEFPLLCIILFLSAFESCAYLLALFLSLSPWSEYLPSYIYDPSSPTTYDIHAFHSFLMSAVLFRYRYSVSGSYIVFIYAYFSATYVGPNGNIEQGAQPCHSFIHFTHVTCHTSRCHVLVAYWRASAEEGVAFASCLDANHDTNLRVLLSAWGFLAIELNYRLKAS